MNKPKRQMTKPPTELQVITRQYTGILWQLKGSIGALKGLPYRLPKQGLLVADKLSTHPQYYKDKLSSQLANAINTLEYCEYLIQQLSQSHRDAYRHTNILSSLDAKPKDVDTSSRRRKYAAGVIRWDRKKALDFITIYKGGKYWGAGVFNYEGVEFDADYAHYMIEYFVELGLITAEEGELKNE